MGDLKLVAYGCRKCNRIGWVDSDEQTAAPEHVSYRGFDIGTCPGKMVPLYSVDTNPLQED